MSFILEALKKVDRKKDGHAQDGVVMQGGRRWGDARFPWVLTAVVLVAIGALALATVAFFRSLPGGEAGEVEPASEQAAVSTGQASPSSSVAVPAEGGATSSDDVAGPDPDNSPPPVDSAEQVETAEVVETMPIEDEAAKLDEMEEPATAPPVTLVGRRSEGLVAPEAPDGDDGADGADGTGEPPPSELPPLVLQGTSVVDGEPVAVVNYQRLFEGDVIEGARVVKILDRAVELEFKGTRFTIRL